MQNLLSLAEFLQNYAGAIDSGFSKFVQASPFFAKQYIQRQAGKKLNSTKEQYIEAIRTKLTQNVLVIDLDPENWIANAVENGVGPFDQKVGMLKSPKVKIGKSGYKYLIIPMGKKKDGPGGKTEKSQDIQQKINQAFSAKKFGITRLKANVNGQITQTQQVMSDDISGLYRYRQFDSIEDYHSGKKKPQWQAVMFRIVSEDPKSKDKWMHPGITAQHLLRDAQNFLAQNLPTMLEGFLESEINKVISKMDTTPRG